MIFAPFPKQRDVKPGIRLTKCSTAGAPDDWKPMSSNGAGVKEIRIRDALGAYCVIYLAKLTDAIYGLLCFQKKTSAPARRMFPWPASGSGK